MALSSQGRPSDFFGNKRQITTSGVPDRADALVWAFTELLVEEIASWGIYETTRRKAEALVKERLAAAEAGRPKTEYAPGSMEYQALHPDWKPQEESY